MIIEVEPYSVLELVVGSGGGPGVVGTALVVTDIDEQRRRMKDRRQKEIHLPIGAKLPHDDNFSDVIDSQHGVSLGGF